MFLHSFIVTECVGDKPPPAPITLQRWLHERTSVCVQDIRRIMWDLVDVRLGKVLWLLQLPQVSLERTVFAGVCVLGEMRFCSWQIFALSCGS